jgi:LacI family transcriptional regulator
MEGVPPRSTYLRQSAVTIRDVAREANVALGTASRVFSGSPRVSPETRERVLAVAERLGYQPNPTARALARGRTNTLGVIVPFFFTRQNHIEIVRGVQAGIADYDYSLAIHSIERPEQARAQFRAFTRAGRVDGLLIVSLAASLIADDLEEVSLPMLCVDTVVPGLASLTPDHEMGAYLGTRHLIDVHKHKVIAFVDRPQDRVSHANSPERERGFRRAHEEAGLAPDAQVMVLEEYTPDGGYRAARRLLDLQTPPSAFVCASDLQAIGVMRAARELGLRVGRDIAIVGYNDALIAEYLGLSTIHIPSFQIGRDAVSALLAMAEGRAAAPVVDHLVPRLVTRTSCGCGE